MGAALVPLLAALAAADALGAWTANGAKLDLKDEGGKIVGRLAAEGGPCPVKKGTELIKGTLLDDSLSAQVRLCLIAQQCGPAEDTALAVLLVTKTLTGGVHTRAACAQDVRSLVLRRTGAAPVAMKPPPANKRLSQTPPPPVPSTNTTIAQNTKIDTTAIGDIPGRPVGEPEHPPGYDPRDARNKDTPKGAVDKLLVEGAAWLQEGKFERARSAFHGAMEKDPKRAEAYNGMGVTFYARGDYDEALAWYKKSLEADPRFGDAYYNMACVYALQAHKDLAFRYLRMAALNHYSERELMEKDSDLASLRDDAQWNEILAQMSAEAKTRP